MRRVRARIEQSFVTKGGCGGLLKSSRNKENEYSRTSNQEKCSMHPRPFRCQEDSAEEGNESARSSAGCGSQ